MNDVHCRIATAADISMLSGMMQQFYAEQSLTYSPVTLDALRTLINSPSLGLACIVESTATPVGYFLLTFFFSLERGGRASLLDELFILPSARSHGHGSAALQAALDLARQHNCRSIHLEVDHNNHRARRLYETRGFNSPGHERDFLTLML